MYFKFRKKEYQVLRDSNQFTLSQKVGDEYCNIGYYKDPHYLIRKLISLHLVSAPEGKELSKNLAKVSNELGKVLNNAVKATIELDDDTIEPCP